VAGTFDGQGKLVVVGQSVSADFPTLDSVYAFNGPGFGFVSIFDLGFSNSPGAQVDPVSQEVTLSIAPNTAILEPKEEKQFEVLVSGTQNKGITWRIEPNVGTVSPTGLYTAPSETGLGQQIRLSATSIADPTRSSSAAITLIPSTPTYVSVSPRSAALSAGLGRQQFQVAVVGANDQGVTWAISPQIGTIFPGGLYYAPPLLSSIQTIDIIATSSANPRASGRAALTVMPNAQVRVSLQPSAVFTLDHPLGNVSPGGLYTAPAVVSNQETVGLVATSIADPTVFAKATITLLP
jgi:hypothetical protein